MNRRELLKREIELLERRSHEALVERGYSGEEITRAIRGPLNGSRLTPADGEYISQDWYWVECLRDLEDARDALKRDDLLRAQAEHSTAREWFNLVTMGPHASRGRKVLAAAKEGHAETHGTLAEKEARRADYQAELEKVMSERKRSLTEARRIVAKRKGVSYRTIVRYTENPNN